MKKLLVLSIVAFVAGGGVATSTSQAAEKAAQVRTDIDNLINATWHRQSVMGMPLTRTNRSYRRTNSIDYLGWVRGYWKRVNWTTIQQYQHPPHESALLCIHRYEGSWQDTGYPFWGGLQMDMNFQAAYGASLLAAKGTADNWTPLEQMWTAEKAIRTRGFYPWPNTARVCGLL